MSTLQCRVTEAVDQSIDTTASLAVGALTIIKALIVGNIRNGINGVDRIAANSVDRTVNSSNTGNLATVVADCLNGLLCGKASGTGCHQNKNMLTAPYLEALQLDLEYRD